MYIHILRYKMIDIHYEVNHYHIISVQNMPSRFSVILHASQRTNPTSKSEIIIVDDIEIYLIAQIENNEILNLCHEKFYST